MTTTTIASHKSWWSRPSGVREVLQVALPLVISTMSWTVMTYVDRMFLYQVSGQAMAAAFSASMIWFTAFCFLLGICSYVNTFVSQYHGDRQPKLIGPAVWQGIWVSAFSLPMVLLLIPLAPAMFAFIGHGEEIAQMETIYFQILCLGAPAMVVAQALSSFYSGQGRTWIVMIVDSGVTAVNVVLDYLWIFGVAGFPAMGIEGAGWATVVALWLKMFIYLGLILQREHRLEFCTAVWKFHRDIFRRLLYYGLPNGVQFLLDVAGFTVFIVLVGRLGELESEATTLAFSVNTVSFMPIWGFSIAASILVGQRLGENRDDLASRATWTTYWISLCYIAVITALYVFTPDLFLFGFFAGSKPPPELHAMAVNLLLFVAAYNVFDTTLMIFVGAIKGAGDTQFVLRVSAIMATLLIGASWFSIEVWQWDIYSCWMLITAWIMICGVVYFVRFLGGKWRSMRVIEQVHHDPVIDEAHGPLEYESL